MVVDDEEFCIAAMKSMLDLIGVDTNNVVDFCINGQEAIDMVTNYYSHGLQYTLIFTDFSMPIKDGIVATKQIRSYLTN
jgi:CheY-like chemotaxis protein